MLLLADYLSRGEHTYTYLARATTPAPSSTPPPPARAELMYQPEINGNTGGVWW